MMRTKRLGSVLVTFSAAIFAPAGLAFAQEGIVRDPVTGDYIITYQTFDANNNPRLAQRTFVPKTKVEPTIHSSFKWNDKGGITYRYSVANGANAKQHLRTFVIDPVRSVLSAGNVKLSGKNGRVSGTELSTPSSWRVTPSISRHSGVRIGWSHKASGGIPPGGNQKDFGFNSADLPSVVTAENYGNAPPGQGLGEDGPDSNTEFGKQYEALITRNFVSVPVAAPTISVLPTTTMPEVIKALQLHIRTWPALNIMDQALVVKIDTSLEQALTALSSTNQRDALVAIKSARKLIKQTFGTLDSEAEKDSKKLAASVLAFNLKYLAKGLNGGQDAED